MTLIGPATSPTVAITRALKRAGLEQGKEKDFQVKGRYRDGERKFTYIKIRSARAESMIVERADDIERWADESGYPFKVSIRYMGRSPLIDITNGPGERVREVPPATEEPTVEEAAAPVQAAEEPAATADLTEAPSCPPGLYVIPLPSTRYRDWFGVECARCTPGVRTSLTGEWDDRGDAVLAARSHYELEHRSADEALTPAELEELERWPLSAAQLRVMWWAKYGDLQEFEDGVWALDVSPDCPDVNKRVARPRISGLWAAGLVGVYGLSCGGRQFVITDTGRRLLRLYFLAERQGHDLEAARDARLPVLEGRERGYPFLVEGRYFVGEQRPETAQVPEPEPVVEEPAPAAEEPAAAELAVQVAPEPEPVVSCAEDYLQEQQAKALGWSTRHAEVVRWAAAGELRMDGPDDLRRVTIPGRAGRRVALALLRPLAAAGFITLGELDEEGRHRVEVTGDGRRALEVWDRKSPTPAVISRKQEGRADLLPLLDGEEHRRRAAEFEADLKRRAAEREAWYAAHDLRRAAEEREERLRAVWAEVEGVLNPFSRRPAGWTPTPEQVAEFYIRPELVAELEEEAARLAAETAAEAAVEPGETSTAPAAAEAVQEAPEAAAPAAEVERTWDGKPGITAGPGVVEPGIHVTCLPEHRPGPRVRHCDSGVIVSVGPKCVRWRPYGSDRDVRTPLDHMRVNPVAHLNLDSDVRAMVAALQAGRPLPAYPEWTRWTLTAHLEHAAARAAARRAARLARLTPAAVEVAARHALTARPAAVQLPRLALPTPAPAVIPATVRPARVIVIPCGAAKLPHAAAAGELYIGSFHRACARAADALARPGTTVLVLSALYGLVTLDRVLDPYDLRMGQPGSVTGDQLRAQARELGMDRATEVVVLAGSAYTAAARQVWPTATAPLEGAGGMGYQLQRLKALREGRYALAA
ncbi:DUF6884 domain-containing protein [Streptomyces sp. OE57]|uniref:DUF6884 domain-containing protein n=1 Tax=Streptomyces lacaronensis TaxID=3379885 RepID=UPI0039B73195